MKPADLSKEVNLPPPTIHRLITGKSTRPYKSSLEPIAQFFSISVDQLLGEEALPTNPNTDSLHEQKTLLSPKIQLLSIVPWDELKNFHIEQTGQYKKLPYLGNASDRAFATIMYDYSMEPYFSRGSTLILDPEQTPVDRGYILVQLESGIYIFRQLLMDADHRILKPLNPDLNSFKMRLMTEKDVIVATLLEARQVYIDP